MIRELQPGIIVSCQLPTPQGTGLVPVVFAQLAKNGGAVGVRIDGVETVKLCPKAWRLAVIAIVKDRNSAEPRTTTNAGFLNQLFDAGADYVATSSLEVLATVGPQYRWRMVFDAWNIESAMAADRLGPGFIATTFSGYTADTVDCKHDAPDFALLADVVKSCKARVIGEGRYGCETHIAEARRLGAYAVCIGAAITRPDLLTARFVECWKKYEPS